MSVVLSTSGLLLEDVVVFVVCINCSFMPSLTCVVMHAYGFRRSKGFICPLCVQFFLYVAYLQLHTVIVRNIIVYPTFQVHSHIPFVFECQVGGKNRIYIGDHSPQPDLVLWLTQSRIIYPLKLCIAHDTIPVTHLVGITGIPVEKRHPQKWRNWFIWVCQLCGFMKIPVVPFHKMLLQPCLMNICFVTHSTGESEVMLHGINLYIIRT